MKPILVATVLTVFVWTGFSPIAYANNLGGSAPLKGVDLRAVFSDTTMVGEYQEYRDITRTYNYTELHHADGTTDYVEGRKKEYGRWKIIGGDKICYKYPRSRYYTRTYCFFVFNVDGCYYKFTPQNMTLGRGPKNWGKWSSRAVRKGTGARCDAPIG